MTEKGNFLEVVIGPSWQDPGLVDEFAKRSTWASNVRFLVGTPSPRRKDLILRSIRGGFLVQNADVEPESAWRTVTKRQPTTAESAAMEFLWRIVPHVKSNAIVIGGEGRLLGIGAGQMNRVQSVRLALEQAGEGAKGAALASDAFFPFPDSIETAAREGIKAVIQPGGSKKDGDVIAAADELGLAMVFTGVRHFRH
jgi:phosphoribosylaminoimidazolecarboxamide formyltransferase/IMP cyclohydrolase